MNAAKGTKRTSPLRWGIVTQAMMLLIFVSLFSSCGMLSKNGKPRLDLTKIQLKEDIITFIFSRMPKIYSGLVKLDDEIGLIDKELERLKEIESEFPKQKRIIATERNNWNKVKYALQTSLSNLEKKVESIYVTYLVNKEKGIELMDKSTKSLITDIDQALEASSPHTKRLIVVEKKSFIAYLRDRLLG